MPQYAKRTNANESSGICIQNHNNNQNNNINIKTSGYTCSKVIIEDAVSDCNEKIEHYEVLNAPVTASGQKTIIWDTVQKINREITAVNDIFESCHVNSIEHLDKGKSKSLGTTGVVKTIKCNAEKGILISQLTIGLGRNMWYL